MALRIPKPRKHWTPRYIIDRMAWGLWQKRHPTEPWLVPGAVEFLGQWLRRTDTLVEFGSGRSTRWFAGKVGHITSIEHHPQWHVTVTGQLSQAGIKNVDYVLVKEDEAGYLAPLAHRGEKFDMVLVDGIHRDHCALWAFEHAKPGGLLVIDNANWYVPCGSRSPASIALNGSPPTEMWKQFLEKTGVWRRVWFSSGVTDTLVMFVPVG
ncbi:MAG: class I SAM-dependent methyltransferase [Phycisphaerales bacterium]|nr:class I SAM-dependent methyltransferase [Phycisphaerales bacterium]